MSLCLLSDRIIVKRLEQETKTSSGIVLPDSAAEKPDQGQVLSVGPGRINDQGKRVGIDVKVGDLHDDGGAALRAFELASCGYLQFVEIVRTKICQRMSLELGPEILHRIEVWCVRRQKRDLNVPVGAVEVFANHLR